MNNNKNVTYISTKEGVRFEEPYSFLQHSAEPMHVMTNKGVIAWANQKELDLLGYTEDEYLGHHINEFHTDQFVVNDILCKLVYEDEISNYPAELRCKDGSTVQVLISANKHTDAQGEMVHTRCVTRNISDLKLVISRTETSNARILNQLLAANQMLDLISSCSWQTNYRGEIVSIQNSWGGYTGQSHVDQQHFGWLNAIHPHDHDKIKQDLQDTIKNNSFLRQQARIYNQFYDTYLYCTIFAMPQMTFDGKITQWQFILVDQTRIVDTDILPVV